MNFQTLKKAFAVINVLGCKNNCITAKIFGGALLFNGLPNIDAVVEQVIASVKEELKKLRIKIVKEDIRGNKGRNIIFNVNTGMATITYSNNVKQDF